MHPEKLTRMIYVDDSPIHGRGVFARVDITAESFIGTYEGPVVEDNDTYVLWVDERIGRDGRNELRYLNHSSRPNAEFDGFDLYAIEDIPAGAEITFHYGDDWDDVA
ncbi:MAG: SET domain-containing protein-lysine N-methyltransferase [Gammaproteobacteria bacterium]|jgi:SET domain-containing protein